MNPITTTIFSEGGKAVLTGTIKACLEKLFRRKKKNITAEEKKQIEKTAEKMIPAATSDGRAALRPKVSGDQRRAPICREKSSAEAPRGLQEDCTEARGNKEAGGQAARN